MPTLVDPRYPIGKYEAQPFSIERKVEWLADIKFLPLLLENAILNLDEAQLQTPYREGGWTVHQLVHHVADSHMNAYIRFKLALTEDNPTIRPYKQDEWAHLNDSSMTPVETSLDLLSALHKRWIILLKNMKDSDFDRTFLHPENNKVFKLRTVLALYAWHCRHHLEHIKIVKGKFTG